MKKILLASVIALFVVWVYAPILHISGMAAPLAYALPIAEGEGEEGEGEEGEGEQDGGGTTSAPEPASLLLLGSGLVGLWAVNRKRS